MTLIEITTFLKEQGAAVTAVLLLVVGGYRGWYIWRWQYDAVCQERDSWKAIALKGLAVAERIVQ